MTNNKIQNNDDEFIRQLMQSAKPKAPDNLKYRIMHQVQTEEALKRKAKPSALPSQGNVLRDFFRIFGLMYAVLGVLIGGAYSLKGKEFVVSPQFLGVICLVTLTFGLFWLISQVDARLQQRRRR